MRQVSSFAVLIFFVVAGIGAALAYAEFNPANSAPSVSIGIAALLIAAAVASGTKIAVQWEKAVVLRFGRFRSLKGPGLCFMRG